MRRRKVKDGGGGVLVSLLLLWLCHLGPTLVSGQYHFNGIDAVYPLGDGRTRFVINCAAGESVVFNAQYQNSANLDDEVQVTVQCGEPEYVYQMNVVGYVPTETISVESINCVYQKIPERFYQNVNDPATFALPPAKDATQTGGSSGAADPNPMLPYTLASKDTKAKPRQNGTRTKTKKVKSKQRSKRDATCGLANNIPLLNFFTAGMCPTAQTYTEFDSIHSQDANIKEATDLLAQTGQRIQGYISDTSTLLNDMNTQTNEAFSTLQSFVNDSMSQMQTKAIDMMSASTVQLNNILHDEANRVQNLINQTNQQLSSYDTSQLAKQAQSVYSQMLKIASASMSTEWTYIGRIIASTQSFDGLGAWIDQGMSQMKKTLMQLQYHQYGWGTLTRNYRDSLKLVDERGLTPFLATRGILPHDNDDFFMVIDRTRLFSQRYCNRELFLICRLSQCYWYMVESTKIDANKATAPTTCNVPIERSHPFAVVELNNTVFSMLARQNDSDLILKKSSVMLSINAAYGQNQTVWGTSLGEGLITSREYSMFDGSNFKSKCDKGRFGAFRPEWLPIQRLAFAGSSVRGAKANLVSLTSSTHNETLKAESRQWTDPWRSALPQNDALLLFNSTFNADDASYWVYSVPNYMLQADGPVMTRVGKVGYFMSPLPRNDTAQFYSEWTAKNGPFDPRGFSSSLSNYRTKSASNSGFCGDSQPLPYGLCFLSTMYHITLNTTTGLLKLRPRDADMQIVVDLPVTHPKFNRSHVCPPPKDPTDLSAPETFQLKCNDLFCQLFVHNPYSNIALQLTVAIVHENPNCSYQFPVSHTPRTSFFARDLALNLQVCPGAFSIIVRAGNLQCFKQDMSRAGLPAMQELASYILASVTNETQNLLGSYQNMLDTLTATHELHQAAVQNFSNFMTGMSGLQLEQMGFNITQWEISLQNVTTGKINISDSMNITLMLANYTIQQTDFSERLANASAAVAQAQQNAIDFENSVRDYNPLGPNAWIYYCLMIFSLLGLAFVCFKKIMPSEEEKATP